jgi:chemotaxis protein methyltransferase CheR
MDSTAPWTLEIPELSDRDLSTIARLVYDACGINLHEGKRALVAARLQKRLRHGGFRTFRQYIRHVRADVSGREMTALLDAIATNHTSFFREPRHFQFFSQTVLPPLVDRAGLISVWSAGCASGEEPYTIAMLLLEQFGSSAAQRVRLVATDLSTRALAAASAGVYKAARLEELPPGFSSKYFAKGIGSQHGFVRLTPSVRGLVEFKQGNLLEPADAPASQDVIFCRNVMIYFDRAVQQRVIAELERRLAPGGYLFVSHSESLGSVDHGLRWVAPSIYQRVRR